MVIAILFVSLLLFGIGMTDTELLLNIIGQNESSKNPMNQSG
jgi:hypothetical protein